MIYGRTPITATRMRQQKFTTVEVMSMLLLVAMVLTLAAVFFTMPYSTIKRALTAEMANESAERRVTRVFRYQSRIADALLDRYPLREEFAEADPRLISAETRMNDKCGIVARVALKTVEGTRPSLEERLEVMRNLSPCERAARRVEALLDAADPPI